MAPRPLEIFQNSSPSVSFWTLADVQSAGFGGGSAAAAAPSPLPEVPWHDEQFVSADFLALPMPFTGFFLAFSAGGATHSPCAHAAPDTPARNAAATAAAVNVFRNDLMGSPLCYLIVSPSQRCHCSMPVRRVNPHAPRSVPHHWRPRAASMSSTRVNFTRGRPCTRPCATSISLSLCQSWYDTHRGWRSRRKRSAAADSGCSGFTVAPCARSSIMHATVSAASGLLVP